MAGKGKIGEMTDAMKKNEQPEALAEKFGKGWLLRLSVTEWVAILVVSIILCSLLWELGYWGTFRISLSEIPLSLESVASVVSSGFVWMLMWCLPLLLVWPLSVISMPKEKKQRVRRSNFAHLLMWVYFIGFAFLCGTQIYYEAQVHPYTALVTVMLLMVLIIYSIPLRVFNSAAKNKIKYCFLILMMCGFFYTAGRMVAGAEVDNGTLALVSVKMGDKIKEKEVIILRNNHDFVYAYDFNAKKVIIMPWISVLYISIDAESNENVRFPLSWPNITPDFWFGSLWDYYFDTEQE